MSRLGLSSRILLALLLTSAVTLVAAALALLSPLQDRLREQDRDALYNTALATRPALERALRTPQPPASVTNEVLTTASTLATRTGARVVVLDQVPTRRYDTGTTPDGLNDVYASIVGDRVVSSSSGEGERLVVPLRPRGRKGPPWFLALRKSDTGARRAVDAVRDAFVVAAVVGLGVALLLGLALSTGLARRLGRLRRAALRLAAEGPEAPAPYDDGADEV
ncbi:MAG: hypothetical protein HZB46_19175, partial [Solirubrobacterales bacterium]|nr:hypothetical protein [Solirubrobacterales bacterium]